MKRRSLAAPLLGLIAAVSWVQPAGALQGPNLGGTVTCSKGPPQVVVTESTPRPVSADVVASGGVQCSGPQNQAPGSFGPTDTRRLSAPAPAPGSPCHFAYQIPVQFRLDGLTPEDDFLQPVQSSNPPAPSWFDVGWHPVPTNAVLTSDPVYGPWYTSGGIYGLAQVTDLYIEWDFDGLWNDQSQCQPKPPNVSGWQAPCPQANRPQINACYTPTLPPAPVVGPATPPDRLNVDLNALVRGRFTGGQISSLPNNPNPGLTQVPTCFYVTGMTVNGVVGDPLQDLFWEQIVPGPFVAGGEGRRIYYTLLIHVSYQKAVWDFGDGTTWEVPAGGSSRENPPSQCGNVPGQQFLVAHTYKRYSQVGTPYRVQVRHYFGVEVTEMWWDAASPPAHVVQYPNPVPPVEIDATNQPYPKAVIQEEGVPVD